jgi:putative transposase
VTHQNSIEWYSAAEFAVLCLPGLPKNKSKMNELIKREGWKTRVDRLGFSLARKRQARGGGFEFSIKLLPPVARRKLTGDRAFGADKVEGVASNKSAISLWDWFRQQPNSVKLEAKRRLAIIDDVMVNCESGSSKSASVASSSAYFSISSSTIWKWLSMVKGCNEADWLPYLAPRKILSKKEIHEIPNSESLHHEIVKMGHQLTMLSTQVASLERRLSLNETEH